MTFELGHGQCTGQRKLSSCRVSQNKTKPKQKKPKPHSNIIRLKKQKPPAASFYFAFRHVWTRIKHIPSQSVNDTHQTYPFTKFELYRSKTNSFTSTFLTADVKRRVIKTGMTVLSSAVAAAALSKIFFKSLRKSNKNKQKQNKTNKKVRVLSRPDAYQQ